MEYKLFRKLYEEVKICKDLEYYIAERGGEEWMDDYEMNEVVQILNDIYELGKMGIAELRENELSISRAEMSRSYGIPEKTLLYWEQGKREMTPYLMCLIAYSVYVTKNYNERKRMSL